jgi:hypothetical protein
MNALPIRSLLAVAALAVLSGCSSVDNWFAHRDPNANSVNLGANPPPVARPAANPGEKPIVLPVASQDINCPTVDVAEGGAALRIGGTDNAECDPAGPGQATLKIGVAGDVVIGPAGSAGTYNAPLKIAVTNNIDKKEVFSKIFKVEATTDGVQAGGFRVVTEPIPLPLTTLQMADQYTITVGFASGGASAPPKRHRQKNAG